MYLQAKVDGEAMAQMATAPRPLGPQFPVEKVEQADSMEVWCSSMMDVGEDLTRFDLKKGGKVIASAIIPGY
jgi:hypothetical protein